MSYFVVSEAGISWDLSSHVYNDGTGTLGATFLNGLVEHSTSCSLWMEEKSGLVTMCFPGNASNLAGDEAVVEEQGYSMLLEIESMRQDDKDMT